MPQREMVHELDPKENLKNQIGDKIAELEIYNNQVLVAVYVRPEKTKSGIYLPDAHRAEDQYQSKVGLVLMKGPSAFAVSEDSEWFKDIDVAVGDWIVFRPSDGWAITINNVLCRMLDDTSVRGKVTHPDTVW
jgi:co-chaperonin GroES (HSP10)